MTKLASLLLGLTIAVAPAFAQEQDNTDKKLLLVHDCAPADVILPRIQEEWGERAFALGTAIVSLIDGSLVEGVLIMNVNPKTFTYTINILFDDDMMCMLTAGEDFQPAQITPKLKL